MAQALSTGPVHMTSFQGIHISRSEFQKETETYLFSSDLHELNTQNNWTFKK